LGRVKKQERSLTNEFGKKLSPIEEQLLELVEDIEHHMRMEHSPDWEAQGGDPYLRDELRLERAERAIRHYRGLLDEWEEEFKGRYGEDSQEYKNLLAENKIVRERLDNDETNLLKPEVVERAVEFYHAIWAKYRGWDYSGEQPRQRRVERQPNVL